MQKAMFLTACYKIRQIKSELFSYASSITTFIICISTSLIAVVYEGGGDGTGSMLDDFPIPADTRADIPTGTSGTGLRSPDGCC